ncbi:MAG: MarC family protein, partial [Pseudomonadota bacterium]
MIDLAFFVTAFTTLFVVIDPFGTTPIFAAMTQDMDARTRRRTAYRTCLVATGILI